MGARALRLPARGGEGDLPGSDLGAPRFNCAPFCAHPRSQTITSGHSHAGKGIAISGMRIQRGSKQSQTISIVFGRSLNQRVGGSSPPRFTIHSKHLSPFHHKLEKDAVVGIVVAPGRCLRLLLLITTRASARNRRAQLRERLNGMGPGRIDGLRFTLPSGDPSQKSSTPRVPPGTPGMGPAHWGIHRPIRN
jgi:hypothetical protein